MAASSRLQLAYACTVIIILSLQESTLSASALSLQRQPSCCRTSNVIVPPIAIARTSSPIKINKTLTLTKIGDASKYRSSSSSLTPLHAASSLQIIGDANGDESSINTASTNNDSFTTTTKQPKPSFLNVLWRFTRPHTLIGSAIAIPSIFLLASPTYASFFTVQSISSLLYAMIPSLLMNVYITGLNQIPDVEIDKINKPTLPIAAGDLSPSTATVIVLLSLVTSLILSVAHPIYSTGGLQVALWGSFVLGTLYSLPPFRMKRHPLLAAMCIVAVRGMIINAGFYSHALESAAFSGGSTASASAAAAAAGTLNCLLNDWKCTSSSLFFGVFGIVIALMKDVPDAHGDRVFNIRSFTVRVGQNRVFHTMKNLLSILFGVVGGALLKWTYMAPSTLVGLRRAFVGLGCLTAGWTVHREARDVDAEDSGEVYGYYMYLWKLFYLSYFVMPLVK